MDQMKIESKWLKGALSKFASNFLRNKSGCETNVKLNEFGVVATENGTVHLHLNVDADISQEEFDKLLRRLGL